MTCHASLHVASKSALVAIHSLMHPLMHLCIHSLTHSLIHSLIHLFVCSFIHSSTQSLVRLFLHPSIHPSIHPFSHSFIHSLTHSLTDPLIHPLIHPSVHHVNVFPQGHIQTVLRVAPTARLRKRVQTLTFLEAGKRWLLSQAVRDWSAPAHPAAPDSVHTTRYPGRT